MQYIYKLTATVNQQFGVNLFSPLYLLTSKEFVFQNKFLLPCICDIVGKLSPMQPSVCKYFH